MFSCMYGQCSSLSVDFYLLLNRCTCVSLHRSAHRAMPLRLRRRAPPSFAPVRLPTSWTRTRQYIASRPPTLRPPGEYVLRAWVVDGRDSVRSHLAAVEVKLGGEELRGAAGSHPPSAPPARGPQPVTTGALSDLLVDVSSESESD
eukprot:GHVU01165168.1.p1 GENE.GHVU01165168.1~~GHVU01165168.1.p1  ORF type:complete len:146 (-),score=3.18 GHVU01165168.1:124-561(-)